MHNIKRFYTILFALTTLVSFSQNKQVLYNFAELPQTLLLNPGAETNYKLHVGVPLLSGISSEFGSTGFSVSDLFESNNISINDKVSNVLNQLSTRDHVKLNFQIEVLNAGFRYNNDTYFSFGFYQEFDALSYMSKDPITLITEGNAAYLNKSFNFSQILYKVDALGVLHFGATKKVSEKLTLGGRFKIYSSALNLESSNNTGTFTTVEGTNNIYSHYLNEMDLTLRTSGFIEDNEYIDDAGKILGNTFFGSNLGIGFDVGFTYHVSDQIEITGSIVDLGFIKHKKRIKNSYIKGSYNFDGIEFSFDETNSIDYWNELDNDVKEKIPSGSNQDAYISWRPTKMNASLKYSFGEKRSKYCYDNTYKDYYRNALGVQLYSVFRPLGPQLALTGFFEKSLSNKFRAKLTYTVDDYSFYNIGAGFSAQIGKVNFYGIVDNIAQFNDIAATNNVSLQLGFNVIFN